MALLVNSIILEISYYKVPLPVTVLKHESKFLVFAIRIIVVLYLQVKDMTVCLDKRDASGKIETYQEPLLYRCSLNVHAAWCYDSLHSKVPRTAR